MLPDPFSVPTNEATTFLRTLRVPPRESDVPNVQVPETTPDPLCTIVPLEGMLNVVALRLPTKVTVAPAFNESESIVDPDFRVCEPATVRLPEITLGKLMLPVPVV
jgi:hypothetical protein